MNNLKQYQKELNEKHKKNENNNKSNPIPNVIKIGRAHV